MYSNKLMLFVLDCSKALPYYYQMCAEKSCNDTTTTCCCSLIEINILRIVNQLLIVRPNLSGFLLLIYSGQIDKEQSISLARERACNRWQNCSCVCGGRSQRKSSNLFTSIQTHTLSLSLSSCFSCLIINNRTFICIKSE